MSKALAIARLTLAALIVLACASLARGDAPSRTRVTIRGTGNNITLEETQAPARRAVFERKPVLPDALGEATRLKEQGASDGAVVAYLRVHETELPSVIDAATMARLRKAGAGRPVVTFLSTVAAVDIGATGEGQEAAVTYAPAPEPESGMPAYDAAYGYPAGGGYAAPYPARLRAHVSPHRRMPLPRRQPLFGGSFLMRPTRGRLPIE